MFYQVIFIESLAICALFLLALLVFHFNYSQRKLARSLIIIYILTVISCLIDIIWITINGDPDFTTLHYPLMAAYLSLFGYIGYCWLYYCIDSSPFIKLKQIWVKLLTALPAIVLTVIMTVSMTSGVAFYINENGFYVRGPIYLIQSTIHLYFIAGSVVSLFAKKHTSYATKKHKFTVLAFAAIPTLVLGAVQLLLPPGALTTLQFAIFFSLLLVFINSQNGKITRDSLTKLDNRYSLDNNIDQRISKAQKNASFGFSVILADIDDFKRVNDTYGHMEGDVLLKRIAALLSKSAEFHGAYTARMSGDEFVLIMDTEDDSALRDLCAYVEKELENDPVCKEYSSSLSFGIASYRPNDDVTAILGRADDALYEVKNAKKSADA
jgi:diguanylate cyclase (GGDEF)-like protein